MQSQESIPNSLPATRALEEMTKCCRSRRTSIRKKVGHNESISSFETKNPAYNFDDLYRATFVLVDQSLNFPAIEWCFDDDDENVDDETGVECDNVMAYQYHSTMSRFTTRKQIRPQTPTNTLNHDRPCIPRCTAIAEITKFIDFVELYNVNKFTYIDQTTLPIPDR
jgi:hypothetical protein